MFQKYDPSPNYQNPRPTIARSTERRARAVTTTAPLSQPCNQAPRYQSPTDPSVFFPNYSKPIVPPLNNPQRTGTMVRRYGDTPKRSVQISEAPFNDNQGEAVSICQNPWDEPLTPSPLKIRRKPVRSGDSRRNKHLLRARALDSSESRDTKGKKPEHTYQLATGEETSNQQGHHSSGSSSNPLHCYFATLPLSFRALVPRVRNQSALSARSSLGIYRLRSFEMQVSAGTRRCWILRLGFNRTRDIGHKNMALDKD